MLMENFTTFNYKVIYMEEVKINSEIIIKKSKYFNISENTLQQDVFINKFLNRARKKILNVSKNFKTTLLVELELKQRNYIIKIIINLQKKNAYLKLLSF